jgi:hypothetical protein
MLFEKTRAVKLTGPGLSDICGDHAIHRRVAFSGAFPGSCRLSRAAGAAGGRTSQFPLAFSTSVSAFLPDDLELSITEIVAGTVLKGD